MICFLEVICLLNAISAQGCEIIFEFYPKKDK
jgi:hypothetical protein